MNARSRAFATASVAAIALTAVNAISYFDGMQRLESSVLAVAGSQGLVGEIYLSARCGLLFGHIDLEVAIVAALAIALLWIARIPAAGPPRSELVQ